MMRNYGFWLICIICIHTKIAYATVIYLSALDTAVIQGGSARFKCGYTGHESITWIINELYYTSTSQLPAKHTVMESSDFSLLIVRDADLQMNGSSYQCIAGSGMRTSILYLYVFPANNYVYTDSSIKCEHDTSSAYSRSSSTTVTILSDSILQQAAVSETIASAEVTGTSSMSIQQNNMKISQSMLDKFDDIPSNYIHQRGDCLLTAITIMIGVTGPLLFFILGCGSCGIFLLLRKGLKHRHGQEGVETRKNEAYQIINAASPRNELRNPAVSPIYEVVN